AVRLQVGGDQVDELARHSDDLVGRVSRRTHLVEEGPRLVLGALRIGAHGGGSSTTPVPSGPPDPSGRQIFLPRGGVTSFFPAGPRHVPGANAPSHPAPIPMKGAVRVPLGVRT